MHCTVFSSPRALDQQVLQGLVPDVLKTYEVRGTELLLVRSADPADRRCDRQVDIQLCALFFAGTVSSEGALGLLL